MQQSHTHNPLKIRVDHCQYKCLTTNKAISTRYGYQDQKKCYNQNWEEELIVVSPYKLFLGRGPWLRCASSKERHLNEKPKVITYCIHLSNDGRNLKSFPPFFNSLIPDKKNQQNPKIDMNFKTPIIKDMENNLIQQPQRILNTDWIETLAFDEINMDEAKS